MATDKNKKTQTLAKQARRKSGKTRARVYGFRFDIVSKAADDKPITSIKQAIDEYRVNTLGKDVE